MTNKWLAMRMPFIKSVEKKYKKPLYININIYKTVNPSKRAWMQVFDIGSEIHFCGYSLTRQIQIHITAQAPRQDIRNAWDALRM